MENKARRIYGIKINYRLMNEFLSHIGGMRAAKKRGDVSDQFEKRIMLAVTQVNGCRLCSYYHTRDALKIGMPEREIKSILSGALSVAPEEETVALAFAQHYAETIGSYDADAWHRLIQTYGEPRSRSILTYIRTIMMGNAQGNIAGALRSRFRGQPEPGSSFLKEIGVLLLDPVFILFILIKTPIVKLFSKRETQKAG